MGNVGDLKDVGGDKFTGTAGDATWLYPYFFHAESLTVGDKDCTIKNSVNKVDLKAKSYK